MLHLDSKRDKPDIKLFRKYIDEFCQKGIRTKNVDRYTEVIENAIEDMKEELREKYGIMNPNSVKEIVGYLKSRGSAEIYEVAFVDNKWKTDADVMENLSKRGYQFASSILRYRKLNGYLKVCRGLKTNSDERGFVYPDVYYGKTNRVNYRNPAIMTINKDILWNIVDSRRDGYKLYSVDIKQEEPTVTANMLGIKEFINILESGEDLYTGLFYEMFKVKGIINLFVVEDNPRGILCVNDFEHEENRYFMPEAVGADGFYYNGKKVVAVDKINIEIEKKMKVEEVINVLPKKTRVYLSDRTVVEVGVNWDLHLIKQSKLNRVGIIELRGDLVDIEVNCSLEARDEIKACTNAVVYGVSSVGLKGICNTIDYKRVDNYFKKNKAIKEYRGNCANLAKEEKSELETLFGTRTSVGDVADKRALKRVIMDIPIQGTCSDILAFVVCDIKEKLRGKEDKIDIYFTRHDEVIFEVSKEYEREIGKERLMEELRGLMKIKIDNWGEFKVSVKELKSNKVMI